VTINASCSPETGNKVVVVGVGGAGCHVVSVLVKSDLPGVRLVAADTDWTSVRLADAHRRVELRHASIYGHSSGGNQGWAQRCAEVCSDELREALSDPSFVLIVAGMGGGTGVGASPVIARLAAEAGAPVAAVVTLPAQWEGLRRNGLALEGLKALSGETCAVLALSLAHMQKKISEETMFVKFYEIVNSVLCDCIAFLLGQRDTMEFAGLRIRGFQVTTANVGTDGSMPDVFFEAAGGAGSFVMAV
jgi:cell division protein FtsZ